MNNVILEQSAELSESRTNKSVTGSTSNPGMDHRTLIANWR